MRFQSVFGRLGHLATTVTVSLCSIVALAQSPTPLGSHRDWDTYVLSEGDSKICYMLSVPKNMEPKNVRRGEVYLLVTHRPSDNVRNEISVITGYTYRDDSTVTTDIGDQSFQLFTEGDGAWLREAQDESQMVQAMRRGTDMVVQGTSSRGTDTTDRYSLMGFTAAHNEISRACNVR